MAGEPDTYAAPATDTYALVLVDLGKGVNVTTASGQTTLFANGPTDKSFANYYKEVSYGKYQITGDVLGPFPYTMTDCNTNGTNGTTGMYKAIEPMITGTYNHLIYYFNQHQPLPVGRPGRGRLDREAGQAHLDERVADLCGADARARAQPGPHAREHDEVRQLQFLGDARIGVHDHGVRQRRCRRWAAAASSSTPTSAGTCSG